MIKEYFYLEHKDNTQYKVICSKGKNTTISEAKARRFAELNHLGKLASGYFNENTKPYDLDNYLIYYVPKGIKPLFNSYNIVDTIINIDMGNKLNKRDYKLIKENKQLLIYLHKIYI